MRNPRKVVIYVQLLDEGVPVARPTYAEEIGDNVFRVLPTENYDPDDETWEFPPGTLVHCERKTSPRGEVKLLAVRLFRQDDNLE